jgi:hypothetical protein
MLFARAVLASGPQICPCPEEIIAKVKGGKEKPSLGPPVMNAGGRIFSFGWAAGPA